MLGKTENVIIVILIILLLFGAKRIPELARSIGQSAKEVKKGFKEGMDEEQSAPAKKKTSKK